MRAALSSGLVAGRGGSGAPKAAATRGGRAAQLGEAECDRARVAGFLVEIQRPFREPLGGSVVAFVPSDGRARERGRTQRARVANLAQQDDRLVRQPARGAVIALLMEHVGQVV